VGHTGVGIHDATGLVCVFKMGISSSGRRREEERTANRRSGDIVLCLFNAILLISLGIVGLSPPSSVGEFGGGAGKGYSAR
jgi:hypothetical protein